MRADPQRASVDGEFPHRAGQGAARAGGRRGAGNPQRRALRAQRARIGRKARHQRCARYG